MHRLLFLNICCLFLSVSAAGQAWTQDSAAVVFPIVDRGPFLSSFAPKRYMVQLYRPAGKAPELPGMCFFNPARHIDNIEASREENSRLRLRPFNSAVFYVQGAEEVFIRYPGGGNLSEEDFAELGILPEMRREDGQMIGWALPQEVPQAYFRPFFFKRHEVTNGEYRQFIDYVRDSIARQLLGYHKTDGALDWQRSIDWKAPELTSLMKWNANGLPELQSQELIYSYQDPAGKNVAVGIYPDTMVWMDDFQYAYNEPMTRNYYSHPAFDDYPVVGVSWEMAQAYCQWLTPWVKAQLKGLSKNFDVAIDLPNDMEWEWMAADQGPAGPSSANLVDASWFCDLEYWRPSDPAQIRLDKWLQPNAGVPGNFVLDGNLYTHPCTPDRKRLTGRKKVADLSEDMPALYFEVDLDKNGISGMSNNVSEWMADSYASWSPALERYRKQLKQWGRPESKVLLEVLELLDARCAQQGYLVRGGNWYDEHFTVIDGKNKAGLYAKTFVLPDQKHSTIGFRYVVRLV
ncbi:MAG: SUMF1/EgtB/PvdO family nonheme iron enzyme, partial [Phaeodactylibacter sp.]|nr:SUMF1/EgtB/PvdO family nonheme iron enzyme [Phaeodactylibacter sp.]